MKKRLLPLAICMSWCLSPTVAQDSKLTKYSADRISYQAIMKNGSIQKDYVNTAEFTLFNSRGQEIEKTSYEKEGPDISVNYKTLYLYDDHGSLISEKTFDREGALISTNYPASGGKTSPETGYNPCENSLCIYDGNGRIIERTNPPYRFTYEYNRQGDCVRELIFLNDLPDNLTETEIRYYYRPKRTDLESEGIKGDVRSIRETSYRAVEKFGELQKGERESEYNVDTYSIYDRHGNVTEMNFFLPDGSLSGKTITRYDEQGNELERYEYDSEGVLEERSISQADDRGNLIEKVVIRPGMEGNEGKRIWKYMYNQDGKQTEIHYLTSDGRDSRTTFEYDSHGNQICQTSYGPEGIPDMCWMSRYDDNNRKTEMTRYKKERLDFRFTYTYNEEGKMVEASGFNADGSLSFRNTYHDDDEYAWDTHGNWIQRIEFENGKPTYILERDITYY